jgi:hypothetical protein
VDPDESQVLREIWKSSNACLFVWVRLDQTSATQPRTELNRMPRGASPKREREYKKIEHKFEKEGRYKGREKEVAAVNKQRAKKGETKKRSSGKK